MSFWRHVDGTVGPLCYCIEMSHTRLPKTYPESLRLKPKDPPSALVKARVHERKADRIREDDEGRAHLQYLERWRALEACAQAHAQKAQKELAYRLGHEQPGPHEIVGHLLASLPVPRLKSLFGNAAIPQLNQALSKKNPAKMIGDNELLQDQGIAHADFIRSRQDLRFQLGLQSYKSAQALALYLFVIRAAVDPKVRKRFALVNDLEALEPANLLLRDVVTHIVEHLQLTHDEFFEVGNRGAQARAKTLPRGPRA